jgi:hypothetical protein
MWQSEKWRLKVAATATNNLLTTTTMVHHSIPS